MNRFLINFVQVPSERHSEADLCGERTQYGWVVDMASPCFRSLIPPAPVITIPRADALAYGVPLRPSGPAKPPPAYDHTSLQAKDIQELAEAAADPKGLGDYVAKLIHRVGADKVYDWYRKSIGSIEHCRCNARRKWLNRVGEALGFPNGGSKTKS